MKLNEARQLWRHLAAERGPLFHERRPLHQHRASLFQFLGTLAISVGCVVVLMAYHAVLRLLSR